MRFEMKNVATGSRVKMLQVSWYSLSQVLSATCVKHGSEVALPVNNAIPTDAVIVGIYAIPERQMFNIVISHESFDEVGEGLLMENIKPIALGRFWLSEEPIEVAEVVANDS